MVGYSGDTTSFLMHPCPLLIRFHCTDAATHAGSAPQTLRASITRQTNIRIPILNAGALVSGINQKDQSEEWEESISDLFEWVGMAGLGSQRSA